MKTRITNLLVTLALLAGIHQAAAQGTAFTYNGQLDVNGAPANGSYDLRFTLYNAATNGAAFGSQTNAGISVTGGLFIATLDFGSVFNGANYWLEIAARTNGGSAFGTVSPRQPVTPAPQAIYAATAGSAATAGIAGSANSVSAANIAGTIADSQLSTNISRLTIANTTTQATGGVVITSGFITSANVTNGGFGYTAAPLVTVADVTGSNAVITATVSNGAVVSLTVQNPGTHYSAAATLTIAPPPSNAYQTFTSGNIFNGVNTFNNASNTFAGSFTGNANGSFTGNGSGLTNLNAASLTGTAANLSVGNITVNSNVYLPSTTATAGIIYIGGNTLIHSYGGLNFFAGSQAGNLTLTGFRDTAIGVVSLTPGTVFRPCAPSQ